MTQPTMTRPETQVTQILSRVRAGEDDAAEQLFPLVYGELRRLAAAYLGRERQGHTLQPTALVHEAFLRLVGRENAQWTDRAHFFAIAARAMRRILIDHARRRKADKRGGNAQPVSLENAPEPGVDRDEYLLALDEALARLQAIDERQARVVELRFFGGLTIEEVSRMLGVGHATVERDWKMAKAWLHNEIQKGEG